MPQIRRSVWLLHWAQTHIPDHKYIFAPPSLRPQHTKIGYTSSICAQYNNIFTLPPTDVTFPAMVVKHSIQNPQWNFRQHQRCTPADLHKDIYPYGNLEIQLLNIRPPSQSQELCQHLPDPDNPFKSYIHLQNFIQNRTARNYTWFSWATKYANTSQQSITLQQLTRNLSNVTSEQEYQAFTPTFTHYSQKLQTAQMDEMFTTFKINMLNDIIFRLTERHLPLMLLMFKIPLMFKINSK